MATFLRTRATSVGRLLVPRFVVAAGAAIVGFVVGALAAWYQTVVLLGGLPAGGMIAGIALGCVYLAFAVAAVAMAGAVVLARSAAVALAIVFLLTLPILALVPDLRPWLPSHLVGALDTLAAGGSPGEFLRATGVTLVATAAMVGGTVRLLAHREI